MMFYVLIGSNCLIDLLFELTVSSDPVHPTASLQKRLLTQII